MACEFIFLYNREEIKNGMWDLNIHKKEKEKRCAVYFRNVVIVEKIDIFFQNE